MFAPLADRKRQPSQYRRRLEVTFSGYWYTALTIGLGVVALLSGNNVIYLIESLMLSGMILSGVLSERTVSAVKMDLQRLPTTAGRASRDRLVVANQSKFPVFCVEIGEWRAGKFHSFAFVPRIGPNSKAFVQVRQVFSSRGLHRWDAIAIGTRYPFGFARKVRFIEGSGERLIWPERMQEAHAPRGLSSHQSGSRGGDDFAEGEVRLLTPDDDYRGVVWTLSAKGGDPYVRIRKSEQESPEVRIDLRTQGGEQFERQLVAAAQPFHRQKNENAISGGILIVHRHEGKQVVRGKMPALNCLALAEAQGERRSG